MCVGWREAGRETTRTTTAPGTSRPSAVFGPGGPGRRGGVDAGPRGAGDRAAGRRPRAQRWWGGGPLCCSSSGVCGAGPAPFFAAARAPRARQAGSTADRSVQGAVAPPLPSLRSGAARPTRRSWAPRAGSARPGPARRCIGRTLQPVMKVLLSSLRPSGWRGLYVQGARRHGPRSPSSPAGKRGVTEQEKQMRDHLE